MWTTVHIAIGKDRALKIEEELRNMGFLVRVNCFGLEGNDELYEIIAPELEVEDIQEAMLELAII